MVSKESITIGMFLHIFTRCNFFDFLSLSSIGMNIYYRQK